jgi:Bacterial capsule synthesis protein PGA_cap
MLREIMKYSQSNLVCCLALALLSPVGNSANAGENQNASVQLVFAGDIMLDLLPGEDLALGKDLFAEFADIFSKADLSIGNLEALHFPCQAYGPERRQKAFRSHLSGQQPHRRFWPRGVS